MKQQRVKISLTLTEELIFTSKEDFFVNNDEYISSNKAAKLLSINSTLINRITGSLLVAEEVGKFGEFKYHDIGLRIKFCKQEKEVRIFNILKYTTNFSHLYSSTNLFALQLFGYTHKKDNFWYYSQKAVQLLQLYVEKFPDLFVNINKNLTSSTFTVSELFPQGYFQFSFTYCNIIR